VLLLGSIIVLVTMFAQPEMAQATKDEPLGNPTAPRLVSLSDGAGDNGHELALLLRTGWWSRLTSTERGRCTTIASSPALTMPATRSQIENLLLTATLSRRVLASRCAAGGAVVLRVPLLKDFVAAVDLHGIWLTVHRIVRRGGRPAARSAVADDRDDQSLSQDAGLDL
jgi:hypothetical protein